MVENNSTATSYEPYKSNTYEVNLGKNLINNTATTQTINGITFTINEDKTVLVNGTSTAITPIVLIDKNFILPKGKYTLSGCPKGGGVNTWRIDINNGALPSQRDEGNGATFTLTEDLEVFNVRIRIANGVTVDNLLFKPMLEKGSTIHSYIPYGKYGIEVKTVGKNLLNLTNN